MGQAKLKAKSASQSQSLTDVVGLEINAGLPDGTPAVHLRRNGKHVELVAAGYLDLPGTLPATVEAAAEDIAYWSLPKPFQAPHAALAVTSPQACLMQAATDEAPSAVTPSPGEKARSVAYELGANLPPLRAGLPEFQAAWAARLFPEGRAPTACSIQVSQAAALNGFIAAPGFKDLPDTSVLLTVFSGETSIAAFQEQRIIFYREHPIGYGQVRQAIASQMRVEASLADSVLQDTFINPIPMIEPILRDLFRQVEISSDYLMRRRNCPTQHFYVCGLSAGATYWDELFKRMTHHPLILFHPFDGLLKPAKSQHLPKDLAAVEPFLMTALGAAQAVLEDA